MSASADAGQRSVHEVLGLGDRAKVLLLGTYHFAFQNRDVFKHADDDRVNILSPTKQAEVAEVARLLAEFQPTKVAVEQRWEKRAELDRDYQAYRDGTFELPANEVHQLGFRVAALCGHERVHPIDEWGRMYDPGDALLAYARRQLRLGAEVPEDEVWRRIVGSAWMDRFGELIRYQTELLQRQTLREHLLFLNAPDYIRLSHGLARRPDPDRLRRRPRAALAPRHRALLGVRVGGIGDVSRVLGPTCAKFRRAGQGNRQP